jgi:hypothetical protein
MMAWQYKRVRVSAPSAGRVRLLKLYIILDCVMKSAQWMWMWMRMCSGWVHCANWGPPRLSRRVC